MKCTAEALWNFFIFMVVHAFISSDFHCKGKVYFENIYKHNANKQVFDLKEINYKSLLLKIVVSRGTVMFTLCSGKLNTKI